MKRRNILSFICWLLVSSPLLLAQYQANDVIINEFIVNPSAGKEWVELLVVKASGVDMRNWRITDLGGPASTPSSTEGVLTFPNAGYLTNVPAGTRIIVVLKTPDANANTFVQDTVSNDGTLVLFSVGIPGGVLDSTRTMDFSTSDNCVLLDGPIATGTVIDIVSWGGSISGWPTGLWTNNLPTHSSGRGSYFTNYPAPVGGNNDDGQLGWRGNQLSDSLTPGSLNRGQNLPIPSGTRMWAGTTPIWEETSNWQPPGITTGMRIIIGSNPLPPTLSSIDSIVSLDVWTGGKLVIGPTGQLIVGQDVVLKDSVRVQSTLPTPMRIHGKLTIDTTGTFRIAAPLSINAISGDVTVYGKFTIDPGISSNVWCEGNWIRGDGSSFSAGNSTFYFGNPGRRATVDRGSFFNMIVMPTGGLTFTGDVNIDGVLTLPSDTISVQSGTVLTIRNRNPLALLHDGVGGKITRGSLRRFLDTTSTARYRFHDSTTTLQFGGSSYVPRSITITARPDSLPADTTGGNPVFIRRSYDISPELRGAFSATVSLGYSVSEVPSNISELDLRLYRYNGTSWDSIGGIPNTSSHSIQVTGVTEFSKWTIGTPPTSVTGIEEYEQIPSETRLIQNYPNPFNPSTRIEYTLSTRSFVMLKVYNILGREVATLTREYQNPGNYSTTWIADGFPSGIYYCRLSAGTYTETTKMLLLR